MCHFNFRAANLAHCGSALDEPNWKFSHEDCVKKKAASSVRVIKRVSPEKAYEIVNDNFAKCYSDLEPIGRRPRDREDSCLALREYLHFNRAFASATKSTTQKYKAKK